MLQFIADIIDQLDLALDQLAVQDRNFDRFALMLVDNVVELTIQRYALDCASENAFWLNLGDQKHDPRIVEKAIGQSFDNKAKGVRDLGFIDDKTCITLLNLHSYRNTSYHKGLRHERILHSLAIFYFINACNLLLNYEPKFLGWCSRDVYSHRARKYLGKIQMLDNHTIAIHSAFMRLKEVAESLSSDLVKDLATDMDAIIKEYDEAIDFLANDSPNQCTRNQVIINVQSCAFAFTVEGKKFALKNNCPEKHVKPYIEWFAQNYKWAVGSDPVISWRKRLTSLKHETELHRAFKRYCDFMHQTQILRSLLDEATYQLDAKIQQEVDIIRGK